MKDSHGKEAAYHSEEVDIIALSNAVVKPPAMMIKPTHASIALATVLG